MSEWKPIETAPKDGTFVDAYDAYNGTRMVTKWTKYPAFFSEIAGREEGWKNWDYNWNHGPTHWMPLPSPPEARSE